MYNNKHNLNFGVAVFFVEFDLNDGMHVLVNFEFLTTFCELYTVTQPQKCKIFIKARPLVLLLAHSKQLQSSW